jgi:hypothetical protein
MAGRSSKPLASKHPFETTRQYACHPGLPPVVVGVTPQQLPGPPYNRNPFEPCEDHADHRARADAMSGAGRLATHVIRHRLTAVSVDLPRATFAIAAVPGRPRAALAAVHPGVPAEREHGTGTVQLAASPEDPGLPRRPA